ncbi:MAG: P1 family peptidase [Spirochaetales bacterium]|nr:P1 family peptidase [Spirochaetales bacterium]MCF7938441.1 P1 family peptidase [Spirochaetales bacterium]
MANNNSITDVPGIRVGHDQDFEGGTGCSVILCPEGTTAGADVRGGAPGTREIPALDPVNMVEQVHAIYLGGGSAFGLAGANGAMRFLEEKNIGFDTGVYNVPIVPGAVLYDLPVGKPNIHPDLKMGYRAARIAWDAGESSNDTAPLQGNTGAGTGATIGKGGGPAHLMKGGLGTASFQVEDLIVGAMVAVNCFGDIIDPESGRIIAGSYDREKKVFVDSMKNTVSTTADISRVFKSNTTIGVVASNASLSKAHTARVAIMAQDGYARTINPAHTTFDGDTVFSLSTGKVEADLNVVGTLSAQVLAQAILNAVRAAETLHGIPGYADLFG